ncbi:hypothetical protein LINGRAPRIM_LOCUS2935 [Linum grandiflorum]
MRGRPFPHRQSIQF